MQAIHLTKYGKPEEGLRFVEIAEPGDPKAGQILIRVEYAPINDSDLLVASGLYAVQPKLPSVVGNEGAGKVLTVGDGVQNVKVGDRVVIPHGVFSWAETGAGKVACAVSVQIRSPFLRLLRFDGSAVRIH